MPAGTAVDEKAIRRREQKAEWARQNYARKQEEEQARCKSAKQEQRSEGYVPQRRGGPRYDLDSYVEEFRFLTAGGRRSDDIIRASTPSVKWFRQRVLPHITRSICASCSRPFNPQDSGMLTRCSETCGMDN